MSQALGKQRKIISLNTYTIRGWMLSIKSTDTETLTFFVNV